MTSFLFTVLAGVLVLASPGQDWVQADLTTKRLAPAAFPNLPPAIRRDLESRGCTIPQSFVATRAENVVRGRFTSAGQTDWAVLCSVARVSSILVFRGGSVSSVAELARRPDSAALQVVGDNNAVGYSRALGVANAKYIRDHNRDDPHVPRLDHDGVSDIFVEKASSVLYWNGVRWLEFSGAD